MDRARRGAGWARVWVCTAAILWLSVAVALAEPPRLQECEAFGRRVEDALNRRDQAALVGLFDKEQYLRRIAAGLELTPALWKKTSAQVDALVLSLVAQLMVSLDANGRANFVRVLAGRGEPRVLLRMMTPEAVYRVQLLLHRNERGEILIADSWSLTTGLVMSKISGLLMRPLLLSEMAQTTELTELDRAISQNLQKIVLFMLNSQQGKVEEALQVYDQLPRVVRENQLFLLMKLPCLLEPSKMDEFSKLVESMEQRYPNDLSIKYFQYLRLGYLKRVDEALAALGEVERRLGHDAVFDAERGLVCLKSDKLQPAITHFEKGLTEDPDIIIYCGAEVCTAAALLNDFPRAAKHLERWGRTPGATVDELLSKPKLAAFRASSECQAVLARLAAPGSRADSN